MTIPNDNAACTMFLFLAFLTILLYCLATMQLSEDHNQGQYTINRYEPGKLTINEKNYQSSVIISPNDLLDDWPPQRFDELTAKHLNAILEFNPQVVILGTGSQLLFPAEAMLASLYNQNIGVEVMNTAAACRTFNVLAAEDRRVAAALIIN